LAGTAVPGALGPSFATNAAVNKTCFASKVLANYDDLNAVGYTIIEPATRLDYTVTCGWR